MTKLSEFLEEQKKGHEIELEVTQGINSYGHIVTSVCVDHAKLIALVENLAGALESISKPTYGTELCNTDEENNAILAPWVFRYQRTARQALEDCENVVENQE